MSIFAITLLFSGLILTSYSQAFVAKNVETIEENGIDYSRSGHLFSLNVGTNITRPYRVGEKLSLEFIPNEMENIPDLLPINFTIITPSQKKNVLRYWLNPFQWTVDEIEILEVNGLIPDNSSEKKFIGETTEEGNYTLLFESSPTFPPNRKITLKYLAFTKIMTTKEYPYILALPFGLTFIIVGISFAFWASRSFHRSRRKRSQTYKSLLLTILSTICPHINKHGIISGKKS